MRNSIGKRRSVGSLIIHVLLDVLRIRQLGLRRSDSAQDTQLAPTIQVLSLVKETLKNKIEELIVVYNIKIYYYVLIGVYHI